MTRFLMFAGVALALILAAGSVGATTPLRRVMHRVRVDPALAESAPSAAAIAAGASASLKELEARESAALETAIAQQGGAGVLLEDRARAALSPEEGNPNWLGNMQATAQGTDPSDVVYINPPGPFQMMGSNIMQNVNKDTNNPIRVDPSDPASPEATGQDPTRDRGGFARLPEGQKPFEWRVPKNVYGRFRETFFDGPPSPALVNTPEMAQPFAEGDTAASPTAISTPATTWGWPGVGARVMASPPGPQGRSVDFLYHRGAPMSWAMHPALAYGRPVGGPLPGFLYNRGWPGWNPAAEYPHPAAQGSFVHQPTAFPYAAPGPFTFSVPTCFGCAFVDSGGD